MIDPQEIQTLSKEELLEQLDNLNTEYDEKMAEMVTIREELLHRLEEEKKDGEIVGDYQISKTKRVTFKTTIDQAEVFGAIKQAVDSAKLKALYNKGVEIPGVNITTFLSVRKK